MHTEAEAIVALQPTEIEIFLARRDFSGIVEHCGLHKTIDHDPPLRLKQQRVLVAEAMADESSEGVSTPQVRKHEERDLLAAFVIDGLGAPAERDDPGFAQDWKMLDHFVVSASKTEQLVLVGVVVQRDTVKAPAPRVTGCRTPVQPDGALRMDIGRLGTEAWQGRRRVLLLDRRARTLTRTLRPLRQLQTAAQ